ncbi:MAG: outer membrane beta-barrel protein [Verrucomicrobia bacterium]|nr:outer membrane beta-barrel protein [Verrucomicrobiota bacterium]
MRFIALGMTVALSVPLIAKGGEESAAKAVVPAQWQKPAWLKELSLAVHESNDSNIFAQSAGKWANHPSWLTTLSPKLGLDFAPLLGTPALLQVASLDYAPDLVFFHNEPDQTYYAHRLTTGFKGKEDSFSYSFDNAFTFIDGNDTGSLFPDGLSAYGTILSRERLRQIQDRSSLSFRYDLESFFVRPTASLLYNNPLTQLHAPVGSFVGYQNYPDRYDVNGGADLGYKIDPANAVTLGYRVGHQYQQSFSWDPQQTSATNDYQRLLVGYEGKPAKWLTLELQGGPDFRSYGAATPLPEEDKSMVKAYAEATAVAEVTSCDVLALKYKRWSWVSSVGKNPYVDSVYDLSYRHKISSKLSLQAGARAANANYNPAILRDDWNYTLSAGLRYAFTAQLSGDISYAHDWGVNNEDGLTEVAIHNREFQRSLVSVGTKWQF